MGRRLPPGEGTPEPVALAGNDSWRSPLARTGFVLRGLVVTQRVGARVVLQVGLHRGDHEGGRREEERAEGEGAMARAEGPARGEPPKGADAVGPVPDRHGV